MSAKIILQNALTQLEAEREKERADAESVKRAELKTDYDAFVTAKQKELDETIALLKSKFDEAIAVEQKKVDEQAKSYAQAALDKSDKRIDALKSLIAEIGEV